MLFKFLICIVDRKETNFHVQVVLVALELLLDSPK